MIDHRSYAHNLSSFTIHCCYVVLRANRQADQIRKQECFVQLKQTKDKVV